VLDGIGQVLLLRDIVPELELIYHYRSNWAYANFVQFINRAKDELRHARRFRCLRGRGTAVSSRRATAVSGPRRFVL